MPVQSCMQSCMASRILSTLRSFMMLNSHTRGLQGGWSRLTCVPCNLQAMWQPACSKPSASMKACAAPGILSQGFGHMTIRQYGARPKHSFNRQPRIIPAAATSQNFFAPNDTTFGSLGLEPEVVAAMARIGFTQPSKVQAKTAEHLLAGSNTVVAAETGSGKTFSYVAPIASMLLRHKQGQAGAERPLFYHALVLCPNLTLCQQVLNVIQSLKDEQGKQIVTAAVVNSSRPPPFDDPDFILATPQGLISFLEDANGTYGRLWTLEGMQARVKHVVLDEADLLLTPAFSKALNNTLQLLRSGDRRRVEMKVFDELQLDEDRFDKLPRPLKMAAWAGGSRALLEAGFRSKYVPAPEAELGPYWRRQYVFVAATMPASTYADVGSQIERLYPDAVWVSSPALHTSKEAVSHTWIKVGDDDATDQLVAAITQDPDYQAGTAKTLVFAKDTRTADELSEQLAAARIQHVVFHKNRPQEENKQALISMQEAACGVLVCTDAAARGLDIQDVSHVVQADFAANAIDFIHRIGRTGRAARQGKVTSLYREHNVALVEVLQQYVQEGRPLEAAFSRARSFSKKLDRKGTFIPRGMSAADYQGLTQ